MRLWLALPQTPYPIRLYGFQGLFLTRGEGPREGGERGTDGSGGETGV